MKLHRMMKTQDHLAAAAGLALRLEFRVRLYRRNERTLFTVLIQRTTGIWCMKFHRMMKTQDYLVGAVGLAHVCSLVVLQRREPGVGLGQHLHQVL